MRSWETQARRPKGQALRKAAGYWSRTHRELTEMTEGRKDRRWQEGKEEERDVGGKGKEESRNGPRGHEVLSTILWFSWILSIVVLQHRVSYKIRENISTILDHSKLYFVWHSVFVMHITLRVCREKSLVLPLTKCTRILYAFGPSNKSTKIIIFLTLNALHTNNFQVPKNCYFLYFFFI